MSSTPNTAIKIQISQLGAGLGAMCSWNRSADVESLQALLCIELLADGQGYAQLAEVRKTLGTPPDRMTRCIRMLLGGQKSFASSLISAADRRQPLIDVTCYCDSPTVKRAALTPAGQKIVNSVLAPLLEQEQLLQQQEQTLQQEVSERFALRTLGIDPKSFAEVDPIWLSQAGVLLKAMIKDLSALSPDEIDQKTHPRVWEFVHTMPGMRPNSPASNQSKEYWGYTLMTFSSITKPTEKPD